MANTMTTQDLHILNKFALRRMMKRLLVIACVFGLGNYYFKTISIILDTSTPQMKGNKPYF